MNVKNNILKPILITFLVMLFLLVAIFSVLHFFFPLTLSNWFYSMGANKIAVNYMERSYNKTKDYNQLYSLLNLSIKTENDKKTEKYYEIFSSDLKYDGFILNIDAQNLTQNVSNLVKSTLYSEDNYLKNKYILSLVKQQKIEKAFNYTVENSNFEVSVEELGNYLFTNFFVDNVDYDDLNNLMEVSNDLLNYFNNNINVFNEIALQQSPHKIKGLVLGSRINEIAKNLKVIKNFNSNLINITNEQINSLVLEVSKKMALFV